MLIVNCYIIIIFKEVYFGLIFGLVFLIFVFLVLGLKVFVMVKLVLIGLLGNMCVVYIILFKKLFLFIMVFFSVKLFVLVRYVVVLKLYGLGYKGFLLFIVIFVIVIVLLVQVLMEINGFVLLYLGMKNVVFVSWQVLYMKGLWEEQGRFKKEGGGQLVDILGQFREGVLRVVIKQQGEWDLVMVEGVGVVKMVFKQEEGSGEVKMVEEEKLGEGEKGKEWEELLVEQQELWKKVFKKVGYWGEDVGEVVFKGVLFGEIGGLVGVFVRGQGF